MCTLLNSLPKCVICIVTAGSLAGCLVAPVIPPLGAIYTNVKAPIDTDVAATPVTSRSGRSSARSILWLVSWGDASIEAAARDGRLKTIESVDYNYLNVFLGIYQSYTTIARGN